MAITPTDTDLVASTGVQTTKATSSVGKFDSVFDGATYAAQVSGGTVAYTTDALAPSSSEVVSAAVNAAAGGGVSSMPGNYSGGLPAYQASTLGGLPMQASVTPTGTSGGGDIMSMAQQQLAESQASSISMLMIQDQMGTENRFFTTASNLMSSRDNTVSSLIRNVRVG